jgi:hypothetical protein
VVFTLGVESERREECCFWRPHIIPAKYRYQANKKNIFLWCLTPLSTYNYLCNQCLSPLILWVRISIRARCKTLCDKVCQWLATGQWFYPGLPFPSPITLYRQGWIIRYS